MKLLKAIGYSILIYIVSFVIGILAGRALGIEYVSGDVIPDSLWYIGVLFVLILAVLFTFIYYRDMKIKPSTKEGFLFGSIVIGVAFAIQFIMYLGSIVYARYPVSLDTYSGEPLLLALLVLFIATTTFVSWLKSKSLEKY